MSSPPANLTAFPKLLSSDVDKSMDSHKSYELAQALADHSSRMSNIEKELSKMNETDRSFQGYSNEDIVKALQNYTRTHQAQGIPASFTVANSTTNNITNSASIASTKMSALASTATAAITSGAYSWAAILINVQWSRVIYCITWITVGLLLLFYGYASLYWLKEIGSRIPNKDVDNVEGYARHRHQKHQRKKRCILNGGIGGILLGFLFFSYLAALINNALCIDENKKALSSAAFFAIWLVSGLIGAGIGGYFYFLTKVMAGILGGASFTLILTAMFGIQSLFIRVILLGISSSLLTAPLLLPRMNLIQKIILNACTSLIGIVTLLNGVALFAPPLQASSNWLDLWTLLFCSNENTTISNLTLSWGTSAFKGYIAGAVLGSIVGFIFEFLLHSKSGHDADSEWNEYLGTYTSRYDNEGYGGNKEGLELATSMAAAARAGLFEPSPSAWQKMVEFFDSDSSSKPAQYGNLSGDLADTSITERAKRRKGRVSLQRGKSRKRSSPARFSALSGRDADFDDQSSSDEFEQKDKGDHEDEELITDVGSSDDEDRKDQDGFVKRSVRQIDEKQGFDFNRPSIRSIPSYDGSSQISGTTLKNSSRGSQINSKQLREEKRSISPLSSPASSPSPYRKSTPSTPVPATPSLINAITRVQQAQRAAEAWQKEHNAKQSPYKTP